MTPAEYREAFIQTLRPRALSEPHPETAVEGTVHDTDPPVAQRGESLARMHLSPRGASSPPRVSDRVPVDDAVHGPPFSTPAPDYYAHVVPRPPPVPVLSIPAFEPERFAVSTERRTAHGLDADLSDRTRVLRRVMPQAHVAGLSLDHRTGFLLSRIDGRLSIEDLLDVSGMTVDEALSILRELLGRDVIAIEIGGRYAVHGPR